MIKRLFCAFLSAVFLISFIQPCYAGYGYSQMPGFLCELGIKFYLQGRYREALHEFRKALMVESNYGPALEYIRMIEEMKEKGEVEIEKEKMLLPEVAAPLPKPEKRVAGVAMPEKKILPPEILTLTDSFISTLRQPVEIEQGKSIIIKGKNIRRFLVTQPNILSVQRDTDELLVTGKDIGYTYLHIWDDQGRWTLEFLTVPPKPEGPTLEEEMRIAEERAKNFKLRYYVNWSSFETGRRLDSLNRTSYSWDHSLSLDGETPYGNLDSGFTVSSLRETTDLTYFTLGLTEGKIGPFKDFTLRGFDYTTGVGNLAFGSGNLRGVMLKSPAFENKLDYTVFWGREGGGRYAGLSPGLAKVRHSFLSGLDVKLFPREKQKYNFGVFHGWGEERLSDLNSYGYDFRTEHRFDKWWMAYEIAHDSETFAHLLNTTYSVERFNLNTEFRETSRNFKTLTGLASRAGELGLLTTSSYRPFEKLNLSGRLDVYKDRLFPNPDDPDLWNEDFDCNAELELNSLTRLRLDYSLQNDLGRISSFRSHNSGIGLYRTFEWLRRINTYLIYRYYINKNFNATALDYKSNKALAGFRLNLIKDFYYFFDQEFSWVEALSIDEFTRPRAYQTGFDWYSQILDTPFYGNLRFIYRDEENTLSNFSFLSGEDYIEGYSEISYRPKPEMEAFFNTRVRNVWAENPNVSKRMDVSFYAGLRYTWDTGISWESKGDIEGYVFKDLNSDGLRQRDEPPVEGVKVWLGKDKHQVSDVFGHFKFSKIKARKAYLNIDTTTIPPGFTLTVPVTQEAEVVHGQTSSIYFGIASRSEVTGIIFEDVDGDNKLGTKDVAVRGVVLLLEDGSRAISDDFGRYSFRKAEIGKHTLTLDLNTLPVIYLPQVSVFRDFELFEGSIYVYNIPLKRIEK